MREHDPEAVSLNFDLNPRNRLQYQDGLDQAWYGLDHATVRVGEVAMKSVILVNVGAVIAVLLFSATVASSIAPESIVVVVGTLKYFELGVGVGLFCLLLAYTANCLHAGRTSWSARQASAQPSVADGGHKSQARNVVQCFAVAAGMVSLILFLLGVYEINSAISSTVTEVSKLGASG